jgi:dephospho-CoA kinase
MIFITGHHDTGKSTLAGFLVKNEFVHVETSEIVRRVYRESETEMPFGEWANQNGHNFDTFIIRSVESARNQVINENKQDIVITGNRQLEGISKICDYIKPLEFRKNIIVYTEASPEILFQRHQQREDRSDLCLDLEGFKRNILGYDTQMGVDKIRNRADFIILNEGTKEDFFSSLIRNLKPLGYRFETPKIEGDFPGRRK